MNRREFAGGAAMAVAAVAAGSMVAASSAHGDGEHVHQRVIRGYFNQTGAPQLGPVAIQGSGVTVNRTTPGSVGDYTLIFPEFPDKPVAIATAAFESVVRPAIVTVESERTSVRIRTFSPFLNAGGSHDQVDCGVHFIIMASK